MCSSLYNAALESWQVAAGPVVHGDRRVDRVARAGAASADRLRPRPVAFKLVRIEVLESGNPLQIPRVGAVLHAYGVHLPEVAVQQRVLARHLPEGGGRQRRAAQSSR